LRRLRSSGGRPALADATEICRVPLSPEDVKALENITGQIEQSTGTKPSSGQVVSVIVREYLTSGSAKHQAAPLLQANWPEEWNGNRQNCRAAQLLIQAARTTWGRKGAA